jgi:50S ribosomal protein L16 3-hydroxylase
MDVDQALELLGGLSPAQFMRRHWQRRPLLVRQAWPGVAPPLSRSALFDLAGHEDVESRLLQRSQSQWAMRHGPFTRRQLPALKVPDWTLLVQGLDLHVAAAHDMLNRFRFVAAARLDDLMMSFASDGGGVGPHLDSYDVFLLQVEGRRHWRIGRVADAALVDGLPVKILRHFEAEEEWTLDPGDMLYLPPRWGHDGVAQGECMTCSIGFRAPSYAEMAREMLARVADDRAEDDAPDSKIYRDAGEAATASPGRIPGRLRALAAEATRKALADDSLLDRCLGEWLTEPKPSVWFEANDSAPVGLAPTMGIRLDRRSRMMFDDRHIFINGEALIAGGRDARILRQLADARCLIARELKGLSAEALDQISQWIAAGWLHAE